MKLRCPNCQVIHAGMPGDTFTCICGTQLRAPKKKLTKEEEVVSKVRSLFDMLADAIKKAENKPKESTHDTRTDRRTSGT